MESQTVRSGESKQVLRLKLYSPHEAQLKFHTSRARFRVCAFGRQAGKSTAALNELLSKAWQEPGTILWFISPTYDQAKVQYRRLVGMLWPVREIMIKKNQSELRIKLENQSEIQFKSGENFEALRGSTLDGVVIDEVREQNPDLWPMVIRPMLTTTGGWAAFISTPNGFDQFYDLAEQAKADESRSWEFMSAPSSANPLITAEEIENLKRSMSEAQFRQEILAEFVDLTAGKAYYNFTEDNIRTQNPFAKPGEDYSPHLPIAVAMDFNLNPMSWTLGQAKVGQLYWRREIVLENSNTFEAIQMLIEQTKGHRPGIVIIGDAAGKARQTAAASKSDYDIISHELSRANIPFTILTPEANPPVKDRVNTVNMLLKSAEGTVNMWVHPDCEALIRDFRRVTIKKSSIGTFAIDKGRDHRLTHSSDGVGYYAHAVAKVHYDDRPSTLRVIVR